MGFLTKLGILIIFLGILLMTLQSFGVYLFSFGVDQLLPIGLVWIGLIIAVWGGMRDTNKMLFGRARY